MARPRKTGLAYFPLDTDFLNDKKIKILSAKYQSDGVLMYVYLLCEIYKEGYYIEADDDLEYIIAADLNINLNKVKQVLNFLLKKSLFDSKLFSSDKVLTSAGIQRRFQLAVKERARRTPIQVGRFWLLKEEETEPFIKCTLFENKPGKTPVIPGKTPSNSGINDIKKSKVNKSIYYSVPELEKAFTDYLRIRKDRGADLTEEQIDLLKEKLDSLSTDNQEKIKIVKAASMKGWKDFYPLKKDPVKQQGKQNKFHNFNQRNYDYDKLQEEIDRKRMEGE